MRNQQGHRRIRYRAHRAKPVGPRRLVRRMTDKAEPKRIGRPPVPADQKLVVVTIRVTLAQRDKVRRPGMQQRLRDWLDRTK